MAVGYNPRTVTDGLVLALDAGNPKNYNASISTNWTDKIGGNNGTLVNGTYHNDGPFVGAGYVEFDGTGDSLTLTNNADQQFGSSDYTIEAWVYLNNLSTVQALFGRYNTSINAREIYITLNTDGSITHRTSSNGTSFSTHLTSGGLLTAQTWHHVAISKSGTNSYIAVDGVVGSGTVDSTLHTASQITYIGDLLSGSNFLNGKLSNYRILKGTALYTSNFTPPTKPLTAVTNTKLLTCQGNTISPGTDIVVTTSNKGSGSVGSLSAVTSSGNYYFDNRSASPSTASIQLDFKTVQTGVTQIKLSGGGFAAGSTFDLYVNGVLVENDRSTVTLWGEDTITISSTNISSIKIEGSDGYSLGALKFNGTLVSGTISEIVPNGDISLTKEPFAGAGAVDFGGSADGLYTPNITLGSNDWTLEFWIYLTSTGTARGLYSYFLGSINDRQISYSIDSSNQFGWQHRLNDGTYPSAAGSTALSAHTWYHVAAVRVNDDYYTYINGVQDSSYTSAPAGHTYYADGRPHYIGYNRTGTSDFDGLLSNVRFVNGTALYTSNFTPPAEPLTAVTNTELLTCQGQSIKDASSNAHTITVNGDAKATIVSSAFEFDGTDDELNFTNIDVGTGDFTYEAWVYPTASVNQPIIVWHNSTSKVHTFGIWASGQGVDAIFSANARPGSANSFEVTSAISLNTWHHIAFVRASGTLKVYVDGTEKSLSAGPGSIGGDPSSYSTDVSYVGTSAVNENFKGKISAVKIYKGKGLTAAEVTQNYNATKGRYA